MLRRLVKVLGESFLTVFKCIVISSTSKWFAIKVQSKSIKNSIKAFKKTNKKSNWVFAWSSFPLNDSHKKSHFFINKWVLKEEKQKTILLISQKASENIKLIKKKGCGFERISYEIKNLKKLKFNVLNVFWVKHGIIRFDGFKKNRFMRIIRGWCHSEQFWRCWHCSWSHKLMLNAVEFNYKVWSSVNVWVLKWNQQSVNLVLITVRFNRL